MAPRSANAAASPATERHSRPVGLTLDVALDDDEEIMREFKQPLIHTRKHFEPEVHSINETRSPKAVTNYINKSTMVR